MPHYHTYIVYTDKKNKCEKVFLFNFSKEKVEKSVAAPYMKNKPILGKGYIFPSDIEEIVIFESEKLFEELILPDGKSPLDETDKGYVADCLLRKMISDVNWVTDEFITSPPKQIEKTKSESVGGKKDKIFIVHGRDEEQALRLQKHLNRLGVEAKMFEDFKEESSSNTIIEQLEYIRNNVGYAFILITPDDFGCLREDMEKMKTVNLVGKQKVQVTTFCEMLETLKTRARQNVVFEFGLFMGALGRDKVCCLFQEDTQEKPSDIEGILYTGFSKSVKEKLTEIEGRLRSAGFSI